MYKEYFKQWAQYKKPSINYKIFRAWFNEETCPDLVSITIWDPEEKSPTVLRMTNLIPRSFDNRDIEKIEFNICLKDEKDSSRFGIQAQIWLKSI